MSGLVTRLQKQAERGAYIPDGPKLILEAIAELESLRSRLADTEAQLERESALLTEAKRQNADLMAIIDKRDEALGFIPLDKGMDMQDELREVKARLAEADKANQLLRADIAAAAREEDLILAALRLDHERYRTECGYLNVPKIVAAIKNPDMYPHIAQPTEVSK